MKINNSFKAVFLSMMIVSGLTACDKPGTAETAGKKIDQAAEKVSNAVSDTTEKADKAIAKQGEKTGQVMDDTAITAKVKSSFLGEPGLYVFQPSRPADHADQRERNVHHRRGRRLCVSDHRNK